MSISGGTVRLTVSYCCGMESWLASVTRGVATECHDGGAHWAAPRSVASAASASLKHSIGAVVMPAPICPTPAWRCAIPVLMIGSTPESTTSRASMPAGVPPKFNGGNVNAGFAECDTQHPAAVGGRVGGCAADELNDRR